jgi:hypothetical protein
MRLSSVCRIYRNNITRWKKWTTMPK